MAEVSAHNMADPAGHFDVLGGVGIMFDASL